jgi:chalcone synthase
MHAGTRTNIEKRHFYLTDEMLRDHPSLATHKEQSLDSRNDLLATGVTELGKLAAEQALAEWGQPRSRITHLIFHTATGCVDLPGPDYQLVNLLGLKPTVKRYMLYHSGCYAGCTVLRLAKDLAENNPGARVLAVCSEVTLSLFRGPSDASPGTLVSQALFGDGAGAAVVGSHPEMSVERPIYEIITANQEFIPGTFDALNARVGEAGFYLNLNPSVPLQISKHISKCVSEALGPLGITDSNSLFWVVHPGGQKILERIETVLNLEKDKMLVSKYVLAQYGNTASGSVFFVMDEMRKQSKTEGKATTGKGAEFGVALAFGPGLTIESAVLRALPIPN